MSAALGYLVGCLVSSLGPLVIVWIHDRMHWAGLMTRVALGYLLILAALWFILTLPGLGTTVVATLSFLVAWCAISWRDLAPRVAMVARRLRRS